MDDHIIGLIGPCFLISLIINGFFNLVAWICSLFTM